MENQHRKISGYRELTAEEIDLMNRIKAKGAELLALQTELDPKQRNYIAKVHGAGQNLLGIINDILVFS